MAAPLKKKASRSGLRGARRRLSVVSDNKLIEGIATIGDTPADLVGEDEAQAHIIRKYAGHSKKGYAPYNPRKRNQDSILMSEDKATGTVLFGVFDGHGEAGDLVSRFFSDRLAALVFNNPKFVSEPIETVAAETAVLEKKVLKDMTIDTEFSGSTAVMATIRGNQLEVGNIGDSRIIVARQNSKGKLEAVEVSIDHKPDREDEKKRIESRGGRVFAVEYEDGVDGPPRVWLGHMDIPGLAMSRSLGDTVAHTAGVISDPELTKTELLPEDKMIIMGSDGLWEFMSNQEVVDMISDFPEPKKAVERLISESGQRWMREEQVIDDTTVIVAYLN